MATSSWTVRIVNAAIVGMGVGLSISLAALSSSAQIVPASGATPVVPPSGDLVPLSPSPAATPSFSFTNLFEYSNCIESILTLYQNTPPSSRTQQDACYLMIQQSVGQDGLSHSEALELISAANFYTSHFLSDTLYPPKGQRLRIAKMLGFIYEIDQNDPQVLREAAR